MELQNATLSSSTDFGLETVTVSLPIIPDQNNIIDSVATVSLIPGQLTLTVVGNNCRPSCSATASASTQVQVLLNTGLYLGGVQNVTPYIRSKVQTMAGFRGCLGVRTESQMDILNR